MSTTSVPCPSAAASRAARSASAFVMSISSGAATTGTPRTTSTVNLASGICAPPVVAGTVAAWLAQGRPASPGPGREFPRVLTVAAAPFLPGARPGRGTPRISPPAAGSQDKTRENIHVIYLAPVLSRVVCSGSMSDPDQGGGGAWTLLTGHGHVLVEIARNPEARIRDISPVVGLTERSEQAIVADLET